MSRRSGEFVSFDFEEVTIENIRAACISHFGENKQCDVLASEQGPSCSRVDQLDNLTLIYVRFTAPLEEETFLKPSSPKVAKSESASAKTNIPSVVPKSLSITDMMKLGKLVKKEMKNIIKVIVERFSLTNQEWSVEGRKLYLKWKTSHLRKENSDSHIKLDQATSTTKENCGF